MNILELHKHYKPETYSLVEGMFNVGDITFGSHYRYTDDTIFFQIQDFFLKEIARYKMVNMDEITRHDLTYLWNSFISNLDASHYFLKSNGKMIRYVGIEFDQRNNRANVIPFFD